MKKRFIYPPVLMVCLLCGIGALKAQSVKGVVKSAVNHFAGLDLVGTWDYKGVDVQFESDNLLKKAGGHVAAARAEKSIDEQLQKIGIKPGRSQFTFKEDGTFVNVSSGKKMKGKYDYNSETGVIKLSYLNHIPLKAKVTGNAAKMSFLFEADGFLSMVTFLGGKSGISVVKALTSIVRSYDGMLVGMEYEKVKEK